MRRNSPLATLILLLIFTPGCGPRGGPTREGTLHPALEGVPNDAAILVLESDAHFLWNETPSKRFPRFVLYGSGQVIKLSVDSEGRPYSTVFLSTAEATEVLQAIDFSQLLAYAGQAFVASNGIDSGSLILSLRCEDGTYARIVVRGWSDKYPGQPGPDFPPLALFQAVQHLDQFKDPRAVEWAPGEFEIYSWPCGFAGKGSSPWPRDWPPLPKNAPPSGPRWNVTRLVVTDAGKVSDVLGPSINTTPWTVHADGKEWCLGYRPVFPSEAAWRIDSPAASPGAN